MATISLCMIVKNEEDVLARCLDSIREAVDEIIIVDTGSTDRTKEIAKNYTDKIFDFEWIDDFAAARNLAFSKGTMDYLMWLDADDIILEEDRDGLKKLKQELTPTYKTVMMKYDVAFDEMGNPTFSYYRERLIKNGAGMLWVGEIHEVVTPAEPILYSELAICHKKLHPGDPDRNLRIFEKLLKDGKTLEPRQQFYYARELYYHKKYEEAEKELSDYLKSGLGWVENCIDACRCLADCRYMLGNEDGAFDALVSSFKYDVPRAELCCSIGLYFYKKSSWKKAAFWYEQAATQEINDKTGAFINADCFGYIPYMQLCVCYDRMGNRQLAEEYNEKAGKLKPQDSAYLYNKAYFDRLDTSSN